MLTYCNEGGKFMIGGGGGGGEVGEGIDRSINHLTVPIPGILI